MKYSPTRKIEQYRVMSGPLASNKHAGANGAFSIHRVPDILLVIASDGRGWVEDGLPLPVWEHVSVTVLDLSRCPTWDEMDYVKNIFWRTDETVLQFHVPIAEHINCHKHCLHLWRPKCRPLPLPPSICLGPKGGSNKPGNYTARVGEPS